MLAGDDDIAVPGACLCAGVVGIGHDGDAAGLRGLFAEDQAVIGQYVAHFVAPLAGPAGTGFHGQQHRPLRKGVGNEFSPGQAVGPDVVEGPCLPEKAPGEDHVNPGGVVVPRLDPLVAAGDGAGDLPAPLQVAVGPGIERDRPGQPRGGGNRLGLKDGAATLLDQPVGGFPFEAFTFPAPESLAGEARDQQIFSPGGGKRATPGKRSQGDDKEKSESVVGHLGSSRLSGRVIQRCRAGRRQNLSAGLYG